MPTQILRVSVNTVIQQNILKTTLTYENEYGKYGGCSVQVLLVVHT